MKNILSLILIIFYASSVLAQKGNNRLFKEYEDTLKVIAENIMYAEKEKQKRISNLRHLILPQIMHIFLPVNLKSYISH